MAFIRVKGHGRHRYAYLVSEKWTKDGPRQSVSEYLGKVFDVQRNYEPSLTISDETTFKKAILKITAEELLACGFSEEREGFFIKDVDKKTTLQAELSEEKVRFTVRKGSKREAECVLKANEGFICKQTITELLTALRFKQESQEGNEFTSEPELGRILARLIINAGLKVSPDTFVMLYEKLEKEKSSGG
ncbi:MAG: hypothetical protein QXW00_01415 [Candidatus Woesearchaeota archaeon]